MRTIIAGSREGCTWADVVKAASTCGWDISCVICGDARGADTLGRMYAQEIDIPCERYPAQWDVYGKSAGYRRNEQMAGKAEALIALWDGQSKGTKHMIDIARRRGIPVFIYRVN